MGRVEDALKRAASSAPLMELRKEPTSVGAGTVDFPDEVPAEHLREEVPAPAPAAVLPLLGAPLTATSPEGTEADDAPTASPRLVGNDQMLTISREQYRRLAASLHHMQAMSGIKVILIASAVASEGKTLTASNLALTFSESYDRDVLLIDADLRRPSLARTFAIPPSPGLSDGLRRDFTGKLTPKRVSERLTVLPAGRPMSDPMAGLTSPWMRQLIEEARGAFDWVIIDTPPIGLMTDANLLSAMADGVVLVVKAGSTPYEMVRRAVDAIGRDRLLGTVLNRATKHGGDNYYYYGYQRYGESPDDSRKK